MKTIKAYKCSFCDEKFLDMDICNEHENRCYANPKAKACDTCAFLTTLTFMEAGHKISIFGCLVNHDNHPYVKTDCSSYYYHKNRNCSIMIEKAKKSYIPMQTIQNFRNSRYFIPEPF